MDAALDEFWFADRFGWTPSQVAAESSIKLRRLMLIGTLRDQVAESRRADEAG